MNPLPLQAAGALALRQATHAASLAFHQSASRLTTISFAAPPPPPGDPPAPDPSDLNTILGDSGTAPGGTSIVAVPSAPTSPDLALLQEVQLLDSYISLITAMVVYNAHPAMYNLGDPADAAAFVLAFANARNYVATGGEMKGIAAYLMDPNPSTFATHKQSTTVDLHTDLLTAMFASFSLPTAAVTELDGILTAVAGNLNSLSLKFESESQTLNHLISYYYFKNVEGLTGVHEAHVRFFYLQMAQSSWKASVGKSKADHFSLDVTYTNVDYTVNSALVSQDSMRINAAIEKLTGADSKAISQLTRAKGITVDPQ